MSYIIWGIIQIILGGLIVIMVVGIGLGVISLIVDHEEWIYDLACIAETLIKIAAITFIICVILIIIVGYIAVCTAYIFG